MPHHPIRMRSGTTLGWSASTTIGFPAGSFLASRSSRGGRTTPVAGTRAAEGLPQRGHPVAGRLSPVELTPGKVRSKCSRVCSGRLAQVGVLAFLDLPGVAQLDERLLVLGVADRDRPTAVQFGVELGAE
jgi:hypothetical protein